MGDDSPPYEPSRSSQAPSSRQVFTPRSVSDASGGLHRRPLSSRSVGSSDGGISEFGVERQYSFSVSVRVSAGSTSRPVSSQEMIQPLFTPAMMSPEIDPSIPGSSGSGGEPKDPRAIIWIDTNDVRLLEELMNQESDPARVLVDQTDPREDPGNPMDDPMEVVKDEIPQPVSPSHSGFAQGSRIRCGGVAQRTTTHTRAGKRRAQKVSRSRPRLTGQQASAEDAIETPGPREMAKLMRLIGSCLPCLVNHEKVSIVLPFASNSVDLSSVVPAISVPGV